MLAHTLSWPYEHVEFIGCKNTWFQASVTNLWNSPTHLTTRPAEIALPGCEWQQVKTLSYMTWEHIGNIKLIKNIIKSDITNLFYLKIW